MMRCMGALGTRDPSPALDRLASNFEDLRATGPGLAPPPAFRRVGLFAAHARTVRVRLDCGVADRSARGRDRWFHSRGEWRCARSALHETLLNTASAAISVARMRLKSPLGSDENANDGRVAPPRLPDAGGNAGSPAAGVRGVPVHGAAAVPDAGALRRRGGRRARRRPAAAARRAAQSGDRRPRGRRPAPGRHRRDGDAHPAPARRPREGAGAGPREGAHRDVRRERAGAVGAGERRARRTPRRHGASRARR